VVLISPKDFTAVLHLSSKDRWKKKSWGSVPMIPSLIGDFVFGPGGGKIVI